MNSNLNQQGKQIIRCCRNGQLSQLQSILASGIDFKLFENDDFSPLNTALRCGRWQVVRYLYESNIIPLHIKRTPAIIAAAQYPKDITTGLELVFAHSGDSEASNEQGRTALMTAALLGHEKKVTHLLNNQQSAVNAIDKYGISAFLDAVSVESLKICNLLLRHGADPHQITQNGDNAMTLLLQNSEPNSRLIRKLLQHSVDLHHRNHKGRSALSISEQKHPKLHRFLTAHIESEKQQELPIFVENSSRLIVKQQPTEKQPIPNPRPPTAKQIVPEQASWFQAAKQGNLGLLNRLKQRRIAIDLTDEKGCTALIHAAGMGNRAVASFLLANHANIEHQSNNGSTPLSGAIMGNSRSVIELLLKKKANPNGTGPGQYPYLSLAATQWSQSSVSMLLEYGAAIDTTDMNGNGLYHSVMIAAEYYDKINDAKNTIKTIFHHGLDINGKDRQGNTALHILCGALKEQNYRANDVHLAGIAHQLLKLGMDPNLTNQQGFTALQYAIRHHLPNTKGVIVSFRDQLLTS